MSVINSANNFQDFADAGIEAQASSSNPSVERDRLELLFEKKFAYWARHTSNLLQDNIAVFAVYKEFSFIRIDFDIIFQHLQEIGMNGSVKYVSFLPNPNFILIKFKDKVSVDRFKNLSNFINQGRVKFITGQEKIRQCKIFINNFPTEFVEAELPKLLDSFGKVICITPVSVHTGNGEFCEIGQCVIDFLLYDSRTLEDLPYFVFIKGFKVFLSISGKKKICFRCNESTHLVSACPMRFCARCRSLKRLGHLCTVSYAAKVIGAEKDSHLVSEGVYEDENLIEIDSVPGIMPTNQESSLQCANSGYNVLLSLTDTANSSIVQQSDISLSASENSPVSCSTPAGLTSFFMEDGSQGTNSVSVTDPVLPTSVAAGSSGNTLPLAVKLVNRSDGAAVQKRKNLSDNLIKNKDKNVDGSKNQHFLRSTSKKVKKLVSSSSSDEDVVVHMEELIADDSADGDNVDQGVTPDGDIL